MTDSNGNELSQYALETYDSSISKISSGTDTYYLADTQARNAIKNISDSISAFAQDYNRRIVDIDGKVNDARNYTDEKVKTHRIPIWNEELSDGGINTNLWIQRKPVWET